MRLSTKLSLIAVLAALLSPSWGFQIGHHHTPPTACPSSSTTSLRYRSLDAFETLDSMIGYTRYEMVELPDSMMSTTLWVGNLCEFTTDEMLSELFQQVSSLKFVPACVARKPNMESMRYGFVVFRSVEEKETAMELLHGYELQGKVLKVEIIKDYKSQGRIRAPQKIVDYAVGPIKRRDRRSGEVNTLRRATSTQYSYEDGEDDDEEGEYNYRNEGRERRDRMKKRRKTRGRYRNQNKSCRRL